MSLATAVYNFSPGPAMIPHEVMVKAQQEFLNWQQHGISIMEFGHRTEDFQLVAKQAETHLRQLLAIPDHYHVFFLPGGATAQFSMVPMNLLTQNAHADYMNTGIWSEKAILEAKRFGTIQVTNGVIKENNKAKIISQEQWQLNERAAYFHYTPNETIEGIEFQFVPTFVKPPLVADMTSMILSRPIRVEDFGIIYASAQKNIGQAGITIVIIRDDLISSPVINTPVLYSYLTHRDNHSCYNTPPTYSWYMSGLVLEWTIKQGGVAALYAINQRKAAKLYRTIDESQGFYQNDVDASCRSIMNIPFHLQNKNLEALFLEQAEAVGLLNLKGHRVAGGIRASIYNAMPEAGVDALIAFMQEFLKTKG